MHERCRVHIRIQVTNRTGLLSVRKGRAEMGEGAEQPARNDGFSLVRVISMVSRVRIVCMVRTVDIRECRRKRKRKRRCSGGVAGGAGFGIQFRVRRDHGICTLLQCVQREVANGQLIGR